MKKIQTASFVDAVPIDGENKLTVVEAHVADMVYEAGELLILTKRRLQVIVPSNNCRYMVVKATTEEPKTKTVKDAKTTAATAR